MLISLQKIIEIEIWHQQFYTTENKCMSIARQNRMFFKIIADRPGLFADKLGLF